MMYRMVYIRNTMPMATYPWTVGLSKGSKKASGNIMMKAEN